MVTDAQNIKAISNSTITVHGRKMEYNCLRNLPAIAKSYGIKALRYKFRGMPCVVAGAGPSLSAALPILKANQGKYILITVDRALKPLLEADIQPHIVCTSDMDPVLNKLFMGYRIPESIALLYDRDCFWELPAAWRGPLITYDTYFDTGIWEQSFMGAKGFLCKNFTVSHTALYVAQMLGCSPLIMTGVDFAYPDAVADHHVQGAVEIADEADVLHRSHWVKFPGNVLPEVDTTEVFSIAVPAMGKQIEEIRATVINTSSVGCKIPHTTYQPLETALHAYGVGGDYQDLIDAALAADPPAYDHAALDKQTAHVIKSMTRIHDRCVEGVEVMRRLKRLDLHNSTEYNKWCRVFLKGNAILRHIQKDVFSMYLTQRPMYASTKKTAEMLESVMHLPERDLGRMAMEANRHTVFFMGMGVCSKLFVDALTAVRKEMIPCALPTSVAVL